MSDLRTTTPVWNRLLKHIQEREGSIRYFYSDGNGWVTIGNGELVDSKDGSGKEVAEKLAARLTFKTKDGRVATKQEILDDWQRVKDFGKIDTASKKSRDYASVAQLRITNESIIELLSTKVRKHTDDLYSNRPFMINLDARIAAAIVDARYNPAGVGIYGTSEHIVKMWAALNPGLSSFNLSEALDQFVAAWKGRGKRYKERYQERHAIRAGWFREAVTAHTGDALKGFAPVVRTLIDIGIKAGVGVSEGFSPLFKH